MWMWSNRRQYVDWGLCVVKDAWFFFSFYLLLLPRDMLCPFFLLLLPLALRFPCAAFFLLTSYPMTLKLCVAQYKTLCFILYFIFIFLFFIFFSSSFSSFFFYFFLSYYLFFYQVAWPYASNLFPLYFFIIFLFFYLFFYFFIFLLFYLHGVANDVFLLFLARGWPKLLKRGGLWQRRGLLHISFVTWLSHSYAICGGICSVRMHIHTNVRC